MSIWLVIPAFCEGQRLRRVLAGAKKYMSLTKIVVVDDGSQPPEKVGRVTSLRHEVNLGKGAAMKTGADYAFSRGADAVIFMDADLQHQPKYLPQFISYLSSGYDVVFGSRLPSLNTPLLRLVGNKLASVYLNLVFGIYVSDVISGFRALNKKAYQQLQWEASGYAVESEMVARLGKNQRWLKWVEFPIESVYVDKYKGVTIIDAIKILFNSLWWKLS